MSAPDLNGLDGEAVLRALQAVDDLFRTPLSLFHLEARACKGIAAMLDIPAGTVMSRLAPDAELRAWSEQERAFDAAVRERLGVAPPPHHLLPRLLAGGRPVPRRGKPGWFPRLALAASVVLRLGLGVFWLHPTAPPATSLSAYRTHLADWPRQFPALELESERPAEVRVWLAAQGVAGEIAVPPAWAGFPRLAVAASSGRDAESRSSASWWTGRSCTSRSCPAPPWTAVLRGARHGTPGPVSF